MSQIKIDHTKTIRRAARGGMTLTEISLRAGKTRTWASQLLHRIRAGLPIQPSTAGQLANAIGCEIEDIEEERSHA